MYSDILTVQIWDYDVIGYNNLIGQTRINLNKIHKIIQKAVKRRTTVKASMKIKQKNLAVTDRMWFDVFNHKEKDQFGIFFAYIRAIIIARTGSIIFLVNSILKIGEIVLEWVWKKGTECVSHFTLTCWKDEFQLFESFGLSEANFRYFYQFIKVKNFIDLFV